MSDNIKVSDAIAQFLKTNEIRHVFGIIGSANSHIFDSINNLGYTEIICVHHEQAATMAMQTYYRVCGKITAALVTAGGGSSNAITGVMSAWADSLPGIVISGQENTRFINSMQGMRMWGIQGYDSTEMVRTITKYAARIMDPKQAIFELEKGYHIAGSGRPGPVWIDYPMDIQGAFLPAKQFNHFVPESTPTALPTPTPNQMDEVETLIRAAKRPVFWLGHGIRLAGATDRITYLLELCPIPTLVTWAGIDMLDDAHPLNFGRAGVYGNRAANFVVQNADLVIAIGNRMAIPMIGYEHSEFAREGKIIQVDIDATELTKTADLADVGILADAGQFLEALIHRFAANPLNPNPVNDWTRHCVECRTRYPLVGPEHQESNGFLNSYQVIDKLCDHFKADQVITTDMGTALLSGHEAIRIKQGQRLMTSTGLGEMGYGLPSAIGASFALNKGEILCLNCDGGMMMNFQELQTIAHHRLPIKLFIFNNDGYLMIKHTQKNLFKGQYTAVNADTGVTCPDFKKIAHAFGIPYFSIRNWNEFNSTIDPIQNADGPIICDIFMDPEQYFYPKLSLAIDKTGKIVSPPLEDLSPLLSRDELKKNMLIPLHAKSQDL
ncbi:MAG: thiamine pyrophosphate-binding protein [Magnetococcales bacterium]|nr:thiamine pyrophosphate-binding protein [Magnetococcales bacterium]